MIETIPLAGCIDEAASVKCLSVDEKYDIKTTFGE